MGVAPPFTVTACAPAGEPDELFGSAAEAAAALARAEGMTEEAHLRSCGASRVVTLTAAVTWIEPVALPALRFELAAQGPIVDGRADVATVAVLERLRAEACRGLSAQIELLTADELTPGLAAADPTVVQWTLALIAARRPPGVGAAVAALLDRPPPVGDAALAALVALGDPATVPALTDRKSVV